jgi:hypothetical protein
MEPTRFNSAQKLQDAREYAWMTRSQDQSFERANRGEKKRPEAVIEASAFVGGSGRTSSGG